MISWGSPAGFAAGLACLTVLPIAVGFGVARAVRRRERWDERRRARRVAALMRAHLQGRLAGWRLARAVHDCNETVFWSGLERMLTRLAPADRERLGRVLARNRHSARERRLLLADSPLRRELAAQRLGLLPSRASRRALRSAAAIDDGLVAFAALRALARHGDLKTLEWLLEHPRRLTRRTPTQRAALLRAFGGAALPRLTEALEQGIEDPRLLRAVLEALGARRHRAASPLVERALAHGDRDVRVAAARALGRMRAMPCSDALVRSLSDPEWPVRAQAARALGALGRVTAIDPLAGCLGDRTWWVRRHAAYALARLGEHGEKALREVAAASPDRYAREMAAEALSMNAARE